MIALLIILAPAAFIAWKNLRRNASVVSQASGQVVGAVEYTTSWSELDERQLNRLLDGR